MERCLKNILRAIHFAGIGRIWRRIIFLKKYAIFALPPPEKHHSFRPPTV